MDVAIQRMGGKTGLILPVSLTGGITTSYAVARVDHLVDLRKTTRRCRALQRLTNPSDWLQRGQALEAEKFAWALRYLRAISSSEPPANVLDSRRRFLGVADDRGSAQKFGVELDPSSASRGPLKPLVQQ